MNNHFDGTVTGQMAFLIDKNGQPQNIMQFFSVRLCSRVRVGVQLLGAAALLGTLMHQG